MDPSNQLSVNVIGYLTASNGVGQISRSYMAGLRHLNIPCGETDLTVKPDAKRMDCNGYSQPAAFTGALNLIVANPVPSDLYHLVRSAGLTTLRQAYNIGSWWWELSSSPPFSWRQGLSIVDEIWAGSTFLQKVFAESYPVPVKLVPPIIAVNPHGTITREDLHLSNEEFIFLFICDFLSVPERKNPLGIVEAFLRMAFSPSEPVRLVIKVWNEQFYPEYWQRLQHSCQGLSVTLINEEMQRHQVDSLIQLSDCYVSLHRSEGFGLTMAEAMLAGKPVVGTAWSGNMDFMNDDNSYPVAYKLEEIQGGNWPYTRGCWADPDKNAAASILRQIFENREVAQAKAARGRETIRSRYSLEAVAQALAIALGDLDIDNLPGRATQGAAVQAPPTETQLPFVTPVATYDPSVEVSVCLPVYNGEDFLDKAIRSVLSQTLPNFELLIADDCSQDSSVEIIQRFASQDSRISFWQNERRLGLFGNYNECFKRARGKYIKPFAQDDVLERTFLEAGVATFENHPSLAIFSCNRKFIDERGFELNGGAHARLFRPKIGFHRPVAGDEAIRQCLLPLVNRIGEPSAIMFPRRLVGAGFDLGFHQNGDMDYWFRLLQNGDIYITSQALCKFRLHAASTSVSNVKSMLFALDLIKLGRKMEQLLPRLGYTWQEYLECELRQIIGQVNLLSEGDFALADSSSSDEPWSAVDPKAFRELAYFALKLRSDLAPTPPPSQLDDVCLRNAELVGRVDKFEAEIRELLASRSWRATRALREARRLLNRALPAEISVPDTSDSHFSETDHLQDYLLYLSTVKASILKSASWRCTAPLRKTGLL